MPINIEKAQNLQNNDQNYQNPPKLVKVDENSAGVPPHNTAFNPTNSGGQGVNPSGNIIQIPSTIEPQQQMNPPHTRKPQGQIEEEAKHGTGDNRIVDPRTRALSGSHATSNPQNHHVEGNNDSDENYSDDPKSRTSASSRVNFSKLTAEEKERRCHNMSKEVKQLRRKIRNMEERLARANNGGDMGHSHDHGSGVSEPSINMAKDKLKTFKGFELSDQRDLIENLCNVLVQERLKPDSLAYYMI